MDFTIKLISSDNETIEIDSKRTMSKIFIKNKIGNYNKTKGINIPEVSIDLLEKIVKYLKHYKDKEPIQLPKPLPTINLNEIIEEWDVNFINEMDTNTIIDLINAANYLEIPSLVDLGCAYIVSLFKGRNADEMREMFDIDCDLSDEQINEYSSYHIN